MKLLPILLILLSLSACAGPIRVKVRNCIALDYNLYECDLVNNPQEPHRGI
jgi:hypothetical protein